MKTVFVCSNDLLSFKGNLKNKLFHDEKESFVKHKLGLKS